MAKLSSGKTFAVFTDFQPIAKVFPLNYLLCTVHEGHSLMCRKSFPVNSVFCTQPRKFFPLESFGVYGKLTVYIKYTGITHMHCVMTFTFFDIL